MTKTDKQKKEEMMLDLDLSGFVRGGVPTDAELAKCPRIEDWFVVIVAPVDRDLLQIKGRVYRSGRVDGTPILTSPVAWFDRHHRFVRTANTLYALGKQIGQGDKS